VIKNEHQFRVTQGEIERFERALEELERRSDDAAPALVRKAREAALRSQLESLRAEAEEYSALRSGARLPRPPESFPDVARYLIQTRISRGWTQQELAEHCGLKEQQIQRYEANDYEQASLARICELAQALGVERQVIGAQPGRTTETEVEGVAKGS
jgi:HTH-type transcriptional regulator / antitoxin HipB